jgi:gas vesicle protein
MTTGPATADALGDVPSNRERKYGFLIGLIAGSVVGAGLGMLFAPRAVLEVRKRAADSARNLGTETSDRYHRASIRINEVVDAIIRKAPGPRDEQSGSVVRGAQDVEPSATDAKTGP